MAEIRKRKAEELERPRRERRYSGSLTAIVIKQVERHDDEGMGDVPFGDKRRYVV
jgi:hypothetical protein